MRILSALFMLMVFGACSTVRTSDKQGISLSDVEKLKLNETTQASIENQFGSPATKRNFESKQIWEFDDLKTGGQRLSLEFNSLGKLVGVLWLPRPEESERNLKNVFSRYPNVSFKPVSTKERYHSIDTETVYSDNSSMSILFDDSKQRVEAITWFLPDQKTLQSQSESK